MLNLARSSLVFVFFILIFSFPEVAKARGQADASPIKIGVSTALTGPAATWGTDIKNAVLFANEHLANGKYKIIIEDDKGSSKDAVTVAHKLTDIDHVQTVFGCSSATVLSAAPIYQQGDVLMMIPLASSSKISKLLGEKFRTIASDTAAANMLYHYIAKHHRRLAVITEQSDYSEDFLADFKLNNLANSSPLEIFEESHLTADTDFSSIITRLKSKNLDALFINSNSEATFSNVLSYVRRLHLDVPIYGAIIPGSNSFLTLTKSQSEGIIFVDFPDNESSLTPEGLEIYRQYIQQFGPPKSWPIAFATTFEAFRVLHLALESGEDPANFIATHSFNGIFGNYSFDRNGDIRGLTSTLKKISNAEFILVND
jgi:branched-chain amino acid transport system substrate-binding protein